MANAQRVEIETFVEPTFAQNAYLVNPAGSRVAWIIDPGLPPTPERILASIHRRSLQPSVLLTHCHADHFAGLDELRDAIPGLVVRAPHDEAHLLTDARENLSAGIGFPMTTAEADELIRPNHELDLDGVRFVALDVSGHSPGGLAFYSGAAGVVFGGDALFADSIGRYDFHNSSRTRLLRNIRDNLLTLSDEVRLYSGHGPAATIGEIRRRNEVLRAELARLD